MENDRNEFTLAASKPMGEGLGSVECEGDALEHQNGFSMAISGILEWFSHRLMGTRRLVRNKRALVRMVLHTIVVLLGVLTVAKATSFLVASARAERIVKRAIIESAPETKVVQSQAARSKLLAEDLKKQNLFCPPSPREHPIKAVPGIFGDEAYIDGKWYKVGDRIGDAKIIAIGADSVTTEWDGKKTVFYPINAEVPASSDGPPSGPQRPPPRPGPPGAERTNIAGAPPEPPPMHGPEGPRPPMGGEVQLSEKTGPE